MYVCVWEGNTATFQWFFFAAFLYFFFQCSYLARNCCCCRSCWLPMECGGRPWATGRAGNRIRVRSSEDEDEQKKKQPPCPVNHSSLYPSNTSYVYKCIKELDSSWLWGDKCGTTTIRMMTYITDRLSLTFSLAIYYPICQSHVVETEQTRRRPGRAIEQRRPWRLTWWGHYSANKRPVDRHRRWRQETNGQQSDFSKM